MSGRSTAMLKDGRVATRLPAQDLERARRYYSEKLGLDPVEVREGGLRYVCGGSEFALFASAGAPSGDHTQMGWEVDDIEGNYPSKGVGERGAWFRDSEGNVLGIGQPVRG
jgi:catechol 2,3-dioxygenase-like lactoylglutathione lyase family enzyme